MGSGKVVSILNMLFILKKKLGSRFSFSIFSERSFADYFGEIICIFVLPMLPLAVSELKYNAKTRSDNTAYSRSRTLNNSDVDQSRRTQVD